MSGRAAFGPPRHAVGAFAWAVVQLPRAVLWQLRERELRQQALMPVLVSLGVAVLLIVAAVMAAGPLEALLLDRAPGALGAVTWVATRVVLTIVLIVGALLASWQLQGALTAAGLERMALHVQRVVSGDAPSPTMGAVEVVKRAALGVIPSVRRLLLWALTSVAAVGLMLVPVAGPVLVIVAQAGIAALFLAHGAIADNRDRLGLPRRLLLREPALLLGYTVACVPLVLVPPLLFFAMGPVAVGGALVALGAQRRRAALGAPREPA